MSDAVESTDELDDIRQRKRERLEAQLAEGKTIEEAVTGEDEAATTPDEPIHVESPDHFQEVVSTHDLLLVDFYADWCGPCKMLAPIVEALAAESPAAVAKVDSDVHQGLTQRYGVQGLPTLLLFEGGEVAERAVGMQSKGGLESLIEGHA
jgi:thioredoxin 1